MSKYKLDGDAVFNKEASYTHKKDRLEGLEVHESFLSLQLKTTGQKINGRHSYNKYFKYF